MSNVYFQVAKMLKGSVTLNSRITSKILLCISILVILLGLIPKTLLYILILVNLDSKEINFHLNIYICYSFVSKIQKEFNFE